MFTAIVNAALSRLGLDPRGTAPFPRSTTPMLMHKAGKLVSSPDWTYEPKWDGFRVIATVRDGEQALKARLEKRSNGIPVLLTCPSAVAAFNALGVRRIALIHPPWFADDQQQRGVEYFQSRGFDVVYANQMRLRGLSVAQLPDPLRKFTELYPAELYEFASAQVPATAEAVFFSGNGFRAIGMIAALEEGPRSAGAHRHSSRFLVCAAPRRFSSASERIRPRAQGTELRR